MKVFKLVPFTVVFQRFFGFSMKCYPRHSHSESTPMHTNEATDAVFKPIRYYAVNGFEDRKNDVVYGPPLISVEGAKVAVLFPGDVQDYTENMESHRDNKHHKQWNLESTAVTLQRKFEDSHILVIRPASMGFKTFSCFENFVQSNQLGVPEHTPNHNALRHLDCLIKSVSEKVKLAGKKSPDKSEASSNVLSNGDPNLETSKLKLIGFSKGCVVLNQLLHEFHQNSLEKDEEIDGIISKIEDMYWLDGGHAGGKNTWVTDKNMLRTLCDLGINIHVHVTPYQIRDDRRPWIKTEEKAFTDYLTKHGCKIDRTLHFESIPPSINTHFDVINAF